MVGNSNVHIHSRLWCVYEAFLAKDLGICVVLAGSTDLFIGNKCVKRCRICLQIVFASLLWCSLIGAIAIDKDKQPETKIFVELMFAVTLAIFYEIMYCCCIRPLEWKELDPKNAECTSSDDKLKITREIEDDAYFGRV